MTIGMYNDASYISIRVMFEPLYYSQVIRENAYLC